MPTVVIDDFPISVSVNAGGAQGPRGANADEMGALLTGAADLRYYPLLTNPSGYITAVNNGILSLNGLSGNLNLSGNGNISISTGVNFISISGNISTLSGDLSTFLTSTGQSLFNYITTLSGNLISSGQYLYNFNSSSSGNLINSGITLYNYFSSLSGNLGTTGSVLNDRINTANSNLLSTGIYLTNLSQGISGNLQTTGSVLDNRINTLTTNLSNTGVSLLNSINLISGNLITTGANLQNQINLIAAGTGQFSSVKITGSNNLTLANFTGGNNITITQLDNVVSIAALAAALNGTITGSGDLNYIPKFSPNQSGLVNSNIIDSGNQLQFCLTNNGLQSGIFYLDLNGNLLPNIDNMYKIGNSNARIARIETAFIVANTIENSSLLNNGSINLNVNGFFQWNGRTTMYSPSDGVLRITNNAENDFNRLQFGNTTSAFPSIKRSGLALAIRLADDSNFTQLLTNSVSDISGGNAIRLNNDSVGINNISPISKLDVTGRITSSGLDINNRVITSNIPIFSATETWNNISTTFTGIRYNVINSGAITGSVFLDITENDLSVFRVDNNNGVSISKSLKLEPSGLNLTSFTLDNRPFYIYKSNSAGTWTMPRISQTTGRIYKIKSQGGALTLTGQFGDAFFNTQVSLTHTISSGESYEICNDSQFWSVF